MSARRGGSLRAVIPQPDRPSHQDHGTTTPRKKALHLMPQVHTLDRVVIRFAGDSGDGMQLTGDRFTADAAVFGNDISTLPNFPAEIRAPAGTLPGVSSFQLHFANYDIMTPGDRPDVLVAMNPAALKANIADLAKGGVIIADTADFTKRNLAKVGYERQPARRRLAHRLPAARARPDRDDGRGRQGVRPDPQGRLPGQEHVRPGPAVLAVRPPDRGHHQLPGPQVRRQAGHPRRQSHRLQDRVRLRRDHRDVRRHVRGRAGARCRPGSTARSPATWRWPTA